VRRGALLFAVLAAASCVHAPAPAATPAWRLHFDPQLAAADFLNPALRVRVGDREVWVLVDTSAQVHVWARWFVEEAGLPAAPPPADAKMSDSTSAEVKVSWVAPLTLATVEGPGLRVGLAAQADFPAEFEAAGVAGIVSPQLLAGEGQAAVLDLQRLTLRVAPLDRALAGRTRLEGARACGQRSAELRTLSYEVTALVEGQAVRVTLDSGANHSRLQGAKARDVATEATTSSSGLAGRSEQVGVKTGARVTFAGVERSVDLRVSAPVAAAGDSCGPDGLLGVDVLRGCVLVLGPAEVAADCRS
jgi:hypothetical protein